MSDFDAYAQAYNQAVLGYVSQKEANETNKEIANSQNQWNIQQWQRENDYNHPYNQMQRLREAGINPNLAYVNGNLHNISAQSPKAVGYTAIPQQLDILGNMLNAVQALNIGAQTELTLTQRDVAERDVLLKEQQTLLEMSKRYGLDIENKIKNNTSDIMEEIQRENLRDVRNSATLKAAQAVLAQQQENTEVMRQQLTEQQFINASQELQNLRKQEKILNHDAEVARVRAILANNGLDMNSPYWQKQVAIWKDDPNAFNAYIDNFWNEVGLSTVAIGKDAPNLVQGLFEQLLKLRRK